MKEVIVESFNDIGALTHTLRSRKNNSGMDGENAAFENDEDFTKTESYEEAEKLIRFGFEEIVPRVKEQLRKCKYQRSGDVKHPRPRNGMVGFAPNVPNAIQGKIDNMISTEKEVIKKKTLSVVYLIGANCDKDTDYFIEAGTTLIAAIQSIEKTGVQIKLQQCFFSAAESKREEDGDGENRVYGLLNIKNYGHRFDIKKVTFPLAHPSMFRRFGFKWLETVPNMDNTGFRFGYGHAINDHEKEEQDLRKYLDKEAVVINVYQIHEQLDNSVDKVIEYLNK